MRTLGASKVPSITVIVTVLIGIVNMTIEIGG